MANQGYANGEMFQGPVYSIGGQPGQNTVYPAPMIPGAPVTPGFIPSGGPLPPGHIPSGGPLPPGHFPSGGPLPPGYIPSGGPLPPGYIPSGGPLPPGFSGPQAPMMMPVPDRPPCCPPGLEYLTQIDQLLVHQKVNMAEVILRFEMNNAYIVKNSIGQQVFTAYEENDIFTLQCGPSRPFTIHVQDNLGQAVLTLTRPLKCSICCFPCCLQELEVQYPPGNPIGYVVQNWHPFLPKFTVLNEVREPQLKIEGPFCDCKCMSDVIFEVKSLDESAVVGQITKQWGGFMHEGFTDADNFGISFPMDLDVKMKAVMLGACFLIDFMFFETNPHQNSHHA